MRIRTVEAQLRQWVTAAVNEDKWSTANLTGDREDADYAGACGTSLQDVLGMLHVNVRPLQPFVACQLLLPPCSPASSHFPSTCSRLLLEKVRERSTLTSPYV